MDKITINVGGTLFYTTKTTLLLSPYFKSLFEYRELSNDTSEIFIDRDAKGFKYILSILRDINYPIKKEYFYEIEYYQLYQPLLNVPTINDINDLCEEISIKLKKGTIMTKRCNISFNITKTENKLKTFINFKSKFITCIHFINYNYTYETEISTSLSDERYTFGLEKYNITNPLYNFKIERREHNTIEYNFIIQEKARHITTDFITMYCDITIEGINSESTITTIKEDIVTLCNNNKQKNNIYFYLFIFFKNFKINKGILTKNRNA